ncbi:DUF3325 family protein [Pseudoroseomonas cervicalis]|uniref:DUF3325 family protein n=1 Tax=Teichococcus cervicalis TaxID=204525 RepID=UPI0022F193E1|nr:DUF3325 family protein [Pseudoroseomonas cervicalis]WBV42595.1 DUF3325 family protein [Pseudoroseomonas cervicalis]
MSHALALLLCLGGFALLAAAMEGPARALRRRPPPPGWRPALRAGGAALLLLALGLLVAWRGWGLGLVTGSFHLSLAAGLVHLSLIGWGRRAPPPA